MKKLFAIILAIGLLLSTGTITVANAESDPEDYLAWTDLLPRP